jgi:hypothetical protein
LELITGSKNNQANRKKLVYSKKYYEKNYCKKLVDILCSYVYAGVIAGSVCCKGKASSTGCCKSKAISSGPKAYLDRRGMGLEF